jgi:hypothetical protein
LARSNHIGGGVEHVAIDVTKRHDIDRCDLNQAKQITLAVPAATNQADARIVGTRLGSKNTRGQG